MNILCIGDVVGSAGCEHLRKTLPGLVRVKGVDLVICNGENAADGNGITPVAAKHLFDSGVDVITTGNHTYRRREVYGYLDEEPNILRPANFPDTAPGHGLCIVDMAHVQVAVLNIMGTVFMESLRCPFETLDALLETPGLPKIRILDFHAEATGEKRALGFYADGRISAMYGTHTHVPTADGEVLPKGTGYLSDAGMTGPAISALGVKAEIVIEKLRGKLPVRFENAGGPCKMDGVLFCVSEETGLCTGVEQLTLK